MSKVILESLTLINFKGCHNFTINFNESVTNIFGANGTGKSREQDGFTWLLFGKNSEESAKFDIKNTKDTSFNQLDHEVKANLLIDGQRTSLRRVYREKWTKKKGSENTELTGHTTDYYWNDVPKSEKEYQNLVSGIIEESVFKLITNPLYFNSDKFGKDKRREILLKICPSKSNDDLAGENQEYKDLVSQLIQGKTEQDYIKQLNASIKLEKDNLKAIPTRIDEALKAKVESFDYAKLNEEKTAKETALVKIENNLSDQVSAFDEILRTENAKKLELSGVQNKIDTLKQSIENEGNKISIKDDSVLKKAKQDLSQKEGELETNEAGLKSLETKEAGLNAFIEKNNEIITEQRTIWQQHNESEFVPIKNDCQCPNCGAAPEHQTINDNQLKLASFNQNKANEMQFCIDKANSLKTENEAYSAEILTIQNRNKKGFELIETLKNEIISLKETVNIENEKFNSVIEEPEFDLNKTLSENKEYQELLKTHETISKTIVQVPSVDTTALDNEKALLIREIDTIKDKLRNKITNENIDNRVLELGEEQKRLAQRIAGVEKELFVVEKFNKLKMQNLEDAVNGKFKYVKFKLFETQINGGESEICETLVDGVPFGSANTAGKINAGIDIINLLCEFYQFTAPIFIDNRESVTELIETNSQVVNLIVSPEDKVLRIE